MAKNYQYCVAECWGSGFITHEEACKFRISGFPGNVWQVPAYNAEADAWITKVSGEKKTVQEAQAILNAIIEPQQAAWDALPEDQKNIPPHRSRPTDIVLPE